MRVFLSRTGQSLVCKKRGRRIKLAQPCGSLVGVAMMEGEKGHERTGTEGRHDEAEKEDSVW